MKSSSVTAKLSQARSLERSMRPCRWRSTVRSSRASSPVYAFGRSITFATRVGADHDGDLAGEERRRHLLEVLDLGDRAAVGRERLLAEDRGVHAPQERARLEAQLLDEELAAFAVGLERLSLPAGAVEGEHE